MYAFDEKKHLHTLDGKPLSGVTSVIGVVSNSGVLMNWAVNETIKYINEHRNENLDDVLKQAKSAYIRKRDGAGNIGKSVHSAVEDFIKKGNLYEGNDMQIRQMFMHFARWARENDVKFLESEKNVYSRELWIGGICDFVCVINNKIFIGDVKTSSAIYPENFWQTAAYQRCLQEMGLYKDIEGHIIVNLKKDCTFNTEKSYGYNDNIKAFEACLTIYRAQQKLNNTLK